MQNLVRARRSTCPAMLQCGRILERPSIERCQRQSGNKVPSRPGKEKKVARKQDAMGNSKGPHTETLIMYAWKFNRAR